MSAFEHKRTSSGMHRNVAREGPSGHRNPESSCMSDFALPVVLGIALAAATGFRVFLPMLSVAAVAEILAYYIPVIDNLLDSLATPAAFIAGTIVSAAVMTDVPPMVKWTAAVIAGGGIAGLTQGATAALRAHSTVLTG